MATTEEDGQALITVVAMGDLSSDFSIIVMAINGSAVGEFYLSGILYCTASSPTHGCTLRNFTESSDFTGRMWQVDFTSGLTQAGFIIPIVQDNVSEDTEEFSLKIVITAPTDQRVTVGEPSQQRIIIRAPITGTCNFCGLL